MPLNPPETWIFRCLSKLKTIAAKALLGWRVGFFLDRSHNQLHCHLNCLAVLSALCTDPLIEKWPRYSVLLCAAR